MISTEIGRKWRELARELGIKESQLDDIDESQRDIKSKMRRVLNFSEESDGNIFEKRLLDALPACGRKDLGNQIRRILQRNT